MFRGTLQPPYSGQRVKMDEAGFPKQWYKSTEVHGVTSYKTVIFLSLHSSMISTCKEPHYLFTVH